MILPCKIHLLIALYITWLWFWRYARAIRGKGLMMFHAQNRTADGEAVYEISQEIVVKDKQVSKVSTFAVVGAIVRAAWVSRNRGKHSTPVNGSIRSIQSHLDNLISCDNYTRCYIATDGGTILWSSQNSTTSSADLGSNIHTNDIAVSRSLFAFNFSKLVSTNDYKGSCVRKHFEMSATMGDQPGHASHEVCISEFSVDLTQ